MLAVASVLRPSVVTVGPVLPELQQQLGLSAAAAALLTALPVVCFGLGAFPGPALSRQLSLDLGLTAALALLIAGGLVRVLDGPAPLFAGTVAVGVGAALGNVLLPALVRRDFPARLGPVTGLYTSTLAIFAALAALLAVPLAARSGAGWRAPLATWAILGLVALALWTPHLLLGGLRARAAYAAQVEGPALGLLRNRTALGLTGFMGLQSLNFYTMVAWLPSLLQYHGTSPPISGALLSLATFIGIPAGLILPVLAGGMRQQRALAVTATALTAAGWAGLLVAPGAAPLLWTVLLGAGTGSTFPLALVLIGLRSGHPELTPQLSAAVQGAGYLVAATGPLLVGLLHQWSNGWTLPVLLLLLVGAMQAVSGWAAGRANPI